MYIEGPSVININTFNCSGSIRSGLTQKSSRKLISYHEESRIISGILLNFSTNISIYSIGPHLIPLFSFIMAWNRARECCEKYTRGTKIVAEFLKTEGEHSGCLVTDPEPDDNHHSYVLSLPNFIHIAEHLATQSAFSVPTHIMGALDEVIKLRSECNRIHEELGTGGTAADERHKHAIDVFQDVRKILLPKSSSGTVGSGDEIRGLSGKR